MTAKKKDKRPLSEQVGDDGYTWEFPDRVLVKGDILRTPLNEQKPDDGWLYGLCSGGGFGCDPAKIGNAIFMICESNNLKSIIAKSKDPLAEVPDIHDISPPFVCRWERRWYIQIPVGEIFA